MKLVWKTLIVLPLLSLPALAEVMATSQIWLGDERHEELLQNAGYQTSLPAYPPEVAQTLTDLGISLEAAPAGSSPPVVSVDKFSQTITIDAADFSKPWVRNVSTGGGLKIPNGEKVAGIKKPYCASTPEIGPKFIPAVQSGPDTTMEVVHESNTFSYSGIPAKMPYAIRLEGGIFFHEVPKGDLKFKTSEGTKWVTYNHLLGHNASGECIRLDSQTAKLLYGIALKYGGITASVKGQDPAPVKDGYCTVVNGKKKCLSPNYCDEQMLAYAEKRIETAQNTNSGGFGLGGIGQFFQSIFSGESSSSSGSTYTAPKKRTKSQRDNDSWKHPLGDPFGN